MLPLQGSLLSKCVVKSSMHNQYYFHTQGQRMHTHTQTPHTHQEEGILFALLAINADIPVNLKDQRFLSRSSNTFMVSPKTSLPSKIKPRLLPQINNGHLLYMFQFSSECLVMIWSPTSCSELTPPQSPNKSISLSTTSRLSFHWNAKSWFKRHQGKKTTKQKHSSFTST